MYHPNGSKPGDVWEIIPEDTQGRESHFAPYPADLCRLPILATCPPSGMVLDPFCGTGTTMLVAQSLQRKSVGVDISEEYLSLAQERCRDRLRESLDRRFELPDFDEGCFDIIIHFDVVALEDVFSFVACDFHRSSPVNPRESQISRARPTKVVRFQTFIMAQFLVKFSQSQFVTHLIPSKPEIAKAEYLVRGLRKALSQLL